MSRPVTPVLTVQSNWSRRSFAAGHDVVVGSDLRADMRVAHPQIARAHLLLRFDRGKWMAIDNGSPTGMFVNGGRVGAVDIRDGQSINMGSPDGPRLSFVIESHDRAVGQLPPTVEGMQALRRPGAPKPVRPEYAQPPGGSSPHIARPQPAPLRYAQGGPPPPAPQQASGPRRAVGYRANRCRPARHNRHRQPRGPLNRRQKAN